MITPTDSDQVVVDSSGWIEFIGNSERGMRFAEYIIRENQLIVPTIVIYEVCKKLSRLPHHSFTSRFLSHAYRAHVVDFDASLAVSAARVSAELKLAMADAIIYATAQYCSAQLVTADTHFLDLPGVILIPPSLS